MQNSIGYVSCSLVVAHLLINLAIIVMENLSKVLLLAKQYLYRLKQKENKYKV